MKATGIFVILLSEDGFESDCPETKVLDRHFVKSVQKHQYADILQYMFPKNFATEKHLFWSLFSVTLKAWKSATSWKSDSNTCFPAYCGIFENSFLCRFCQFHKVTAQYWISADLPCLKEKHNVGRFLLERFLDLLLSMFFTYY